MASPDPPEIVIVSPFVYPVPPLSIAMEAMGPRFRYIARENLYYPMSTRSLGSSFRLG